MKKIRRFTYNKPDISVQSFLIFSVFGFKTPLNLHFMENKMNLIRAVALPGGRLSRYFRSDKRIAAIFGVPTAARGGGGGRRRRGEGRGSAAGGIAVGDLGFNKFKLYIIFSLYRDMEFSRVVLIG